MSRFGNLEFNQDSGERHEQPAAARNEAFYLDEAQKLFLRGRFEPALRAYGKAVEFNRTSSEGWSGQVRMLIELGEFAEARLWADKALSILADHPELLAAKAVALARAGDIQGAISFSDASIEAPGNGPYIWLARGDVLLARGEKRADYCFEKALALGGGKWVWHWLAARIQSFYEHSARALKHLQEALTLAPAEAVLWVETGRAQLALGLGPPAQRSFEQAQELDPELDLSSLTRHATSGSLWERAARGLRNLFNR